MGAKTLFSITYVNSSDFLRLTFTSANHVSYGRGAINVPAVNTGQPSKRKGSISEFHSTAPVLPDKPAKPHGEFPLFAHAAGVWAKRIIDAAPHLAKEKNRSAIGVWLLTSEATYGLGGRLSFDRES
jgi:hypothetical protein